MTVGAFVAGDLEDVLAPGIELVLDVRVELPLGRLVLRRLAVRGAVLVVTGKRLEVLAAPNTGLRLEGRLGGV